MPEITISMAAGRTDEQKVGMMRDITQALVKNLGVDADAVVIQINEAPLHHKMKGGKTFVERAAAAKVEELGVKAAFLGYHGYPAVLCTSVNNEVIHGIPNDKRVLREGDVVSVDCGVIVDGYYSDAAVTHAMNFHPMSALLLFPAMILLLELGRRLRRRRQWEWRPSRFACPMGWRWCWLRLGSTALWLIP